MSTILLLLLGVPLLLALVVLPLPARVAGRLALLGPLAILALALPLWPAAAAGGIERVSFEWFPSLQIPASFRIDRLGVFFVLLVSGIGLGIFQYARVYLQDKVDGRFWAAMLTFTAGMLGVVLADSLLVLFVAWEATTLTSALLIGMNPESPESRRGAVQAFLVTGAGGLALLAGIVLLAQLAGTWELSVLETRAASLVADAHYVPLALILLGAFTKSAQVPFHFWLPGAMAAPAPVSAFLHSATLVKAGIFLLGRFLPIFGESPMWSPTLTAVGLTTFVVGGISAVRASDLKAMLAHSTVAQLGVLTALYGQYPAVGTTGELLHIANHALYKSSLFLLLGWLEKAAGTRDLGVIERERWLAAAPAASTLFVLGAASMAGLPFLLGFISKESLFLAASGGSIELSPALVGVSFGSVLTVIVALKVSASLVLGTEPPLAGRGRGPGGVSPWLLVVPAALLLPQLVGGVFPSRVLGILQPAADFPAGPALWRSFDLKLLSSLTILVVGAGAWSWWRSLAALPAPPAAERVAGALADRILVAAGTFSAAVQRGGHPQYLAVMLVTAVAVMLGGLMWAPDRLVLPRPQWDQESWLAWVPFTAVLVSVPAALFSRGRIPKVVLVAVTGYGMAIFYVLFRAPDLALTQLLVETVSLLLLLMVFRRLPPLHPDPRTMPRRVLHGLVAGTVGLAMGGLAWLTGSTAAPDPAGADQLALSVPGAQGHNAVNVILVDFRGLDTLGEIAVLGIAAIGAVALFSTSPTGTSTTSTTESPS